MSDELRLGGVVGEFLTPGFDYPEELRGVLVKSVEGGPRRLDARGRWEMTPIDGYGFLWTSLVFFNWDYLTGDCWGGD
jgi:hypothetical protein